MLRAADAGAYSCAKRAIAALTWQLRGQTPPGVTVNAVSPIAATRMVAAAIERARQLAKEGGRGGGGGGLSLTKMPGPEDLAPFGAYLVDDAFGWCDGRVLFAGGSEVAVIDEPRLLEVVRSRHVGSLAGVLEAVVPRAFLPAETNQASDGGGNPRFGPIFSAPAPHTPGPAASSPEASSAPTVASCVIASDRPALTAAVAAALGAPTMSCHHVGVTSGFAAAADALRGVVDATGPVDAVVVAPPAHRPPPTIAGDGWERVLADHDDLVAPIHADAGWARAVADYTAATGRAVRLVTLTDATTSGGRSRAQAAAQLARVAGSTTERRVTAFAAGLEAPESDVADAAGAASSSTCWVTPRGRRPGRCGARRGRGLDRSARPSSSGGQCHLRWTRRPRLARRHAPPDRREPRPSVTRAGPMTPKPVRVVDAHVHLWDPARADWYPYLARVPRRRRRRRRLKHVPALRRRHLCHRGESAGMSKR